MKLWIAPGGLHVEMASESHVPAMAKLHGKSFFHGWKESEFLNYLQRPGTNPLYVACDSKGRVAGFMVFSLSGEECELLSINVENKWRKKGIARALLQAGFQDLMSQSVLAMYLEVDETNIPAIALYQHFGFEKIGERPGYYPLKNGDRATALVMRAVLN